MEQRRRLWALDDLKEVFTPPTFSLDGGQIVFSTNAGICVVDARSGQQLRRFGKAASRCSQLAWSPDGRWVLESGQGDTIFIWEVATGRMLQEVKWRSDANDVLCPMGLTFRPGGKGFAAGVGDQVRIWTAPADGQTITLKRHNKPVTTVAFDAEGKKIGSGDMDGTVKLWDLATGAEIRTLTGHTKPIVGIAFSTDGRPPLGSGSRRHG